MRTITEKYGNGQTVEYLQLDNDTCYHATTSPKVINVLENVRQKRDRIRIWYGDKITGCSWNEENDVTGYVGRSTGYNKIPLLINNRRSIGGGGMIDHAIIKIVNTKTNKTLYAHEKFHQAKFTIKGNSVFINGKDFAPNCGNVKKAQRLCDFMNGKRNNK